MTQTVSCSNSPSVRGIKESGESCDILLAGAATSLGSDSFFEKDEYEGLKCIPRLV